MQKLLRGGTKRFGRYLVEGLESRTLLSAQLIGNIGTQTGPAYTSQEMQNYPLWTRTAGSKVYSAADDGVHGQRLYVTDGTAAGTGMVDPTNLGVNASNIIPVAVLGNSFYFNAVNGSTMLFRTDGTPAGTQALYTWPSVYGPVSTQIAGNKLYIFGSAFGTNQNLVVTDGTVAGTSSIRSGSAISSFGGFVGAYNSMCYYLDSSSGGLWQSDGTAAGTTLLADHVYAYSMATLGASTYLITDLGIDTFSGTAASIQQVVSTSSGRPGSVTVVGAKAYYVMKPFSGNPVMISTDGTSSGTHQFAAGSSSFDTFGNVLSMGGSVYYTYQPSGPTSGLYRVNAAGTASTLVTQSVTSDVIAIGSSLYFGESDSFGAELWTSDGTAAGSHRVVDWAPGPSSSSPVGFSALGSKLIYWAINPNAGLELHASDGTAAGTYLIKDINTTVVGATFGISGTATLNGTMYFAADDKVHLAGTELWKTDGTPGGTMLLDDINPGENGSSIIDLTVFKNLVYFVAWDGSLENNLFDVMKLFRTDGTSGGTYPVFSFTQSIGAPIGMAVTPDKLYFGLAGGLVASDGTTAGTTVIQPAGWPTGYSPANVFPTAAGALGVFSTGSGLWTSDGTAAGTRMIASYSDFNGSPLSIQQPAYAGGKIIVPVEANPDHLWSMNTDGTNLTDCGVSYAGRYSSPTPTMANGSKVFYATGNNLSWSDGTPAGTGNVTLGYGISSAVIVGGDLYAGTQSNSQLWRSDGTTVGTVQLTNLPIPNGSNNGLYNFFNAGGVLAFSIRSGPGIHQIWQSDGTPAGTFEVSDINLGGIDSPQILGMIRSQLLFAATEPVHQTELWGATIVDSEVGGTTGADVITLTESSDHQWVSWAMGDSGGAVPTSGPLTINGNGGSDTITLDYSNGNPLPGTLHLNGTFTINGLQGATPLAGTQLDLGKSTVYFSYAGSSPAAVIRAALLSGYNGGAWNGSSANGVIMSLAAAGNANHNTGIGWADSADGTGVNTTANTIELKYTLNGDANLDGKVDIFDLNALLPHFNGGGDWTSGDSTYNGAVDIFDLNALLPNFNTTLGSQVAPATQGSAAAAVVASAWVAPWNGSGASAVGTRESGDRFGVAPIGKLRHHKSRAWARLLAENMGGRDVEVRRDRDGRGLRRDTPT